MSAEVCEDWTEMGTMAEGDIFEYVPPLARPQEAWGTPEDLRTDAIIARVADDVLDGIGVRVQSARARVLLPERQIAFGLRTVSVRLNG